MSSIFRMDHLDQAAERHRQAVRFIEQHQGQHLDTDPLVRRCAAHLMAHAAADRQTALEVALHALADVQARTVPAVVDMHHSTSHVVRVVDPGSGRTVAFTASELMQLANAKALAADPRHAIAACGRPALPG